MCLKWTLNTIFGAINCQETVNIHFLESKIIKICSKKSETQTSHTCLGSALFTPAHRSKHGFCGLKVLPPSFWTLKSPNFSFFFWKLPTFSFFFPKKLPLFYVFFIFSNFLFSAPIPKSRGRKLRREMVFVRPMLPRPHPSAIFSLLS